MKESGKKGVLPPTLQLVVDPAKKVLEKRKKSTGNIVPRRTSVVKFDLGERVVIILI